MASSYAAAAVEAISATDLEFFESRVRPVLVENCYKCHSREADKVRGGLLLDTRENLRLGGDDGPVIVPGRPDDSALIQAIRYTDPDFQMPKDKKLTDQQIADLTEWVRRGAPDPRTNAAKGSSPAYGGVGRRHWSFQPVQKPEVPAVRNAAWVKSPVDAFILQKLEAAGIQPNPAADKRTLLRRVSFDLVGLPPTEAEVQAFLADTSPDAFAKVVDRLLASPQYGERWGRYWLDVARYADTKGDAPNRDDARYPYAWTYRDWVIDAFNRDMPYNQFIVQQLAADLLISPPPANATISAPPPPGRGGRGANAQGQPGRAGQARAGQPGQGAQAGRAAQQAAVAQAQAAGRAGRGGAQLQPLTIPASADRHSLAALGFLTLGNQFDGNLNDRINDRIDVTTKGFLGLTVSCARCHDHKFDPIPTKDYYSLYGIFASSGEPPTVRDQPMLALPADTAELRDYLAKVAALNVQQDALLAEQQALRPGAARGPQAARAGADVPANPAMRPGAAPAAAPAPSMAPSMGAPEMGMGESMNSMNAMAPAAPAPGTPAGAARGAARANAPLTDAQRRQQLQQAQARLQRDYTDLELTHPGAQPRANVLLDVRQPQNYPVLLRGEAQNRGEIAPRRFLSLLAPPTAPNYSRGSGRLELARDIASPTNPLTARVLVNRVWQHHFGTGFVPTPDDLGNMSAPPTHPELLDYLASRFVEEGWSIKKLHRLILLTSTYQVSGLTNPRYAEVDPDNHLHWRYNLRRLDFEAVHDSLLAIAGTLDLTMGGRSVPIGSADFTTRRAVYTFIDRANPAEILTQFDVPNPSVVSGKRYETIVPQQSLFLMNSPLVIETARKVTHTPAFLALTNDRDRVNALYLAIFQRPPTNEEAQMCLQYVRATPSGTSTATPTMPARAGRAQQQANNNAQQLQRQAARAAQQAATGRGNVQVEPGAAAFLTRDPLDAWTKLAHSLFQTNEAMFYN